MHSFKTHLLLPFDSYINETTAHVLNTAKGWTICFHSGIFLKPIWCPQVFKWPSNIPLTNRQPTETHHRTGWWVWPWIKLLCVKCGSENGTNGCHLVVFGEDVAFPHHFVAPHLPMTLPPIALLVILATPVKKLSKMIGNSASHPVYSKHSELPWISLDLWRNMCKQLYSILRYIELNISNCISNYMYKTPFCKSSHTHTHTHVYTPCMHTRAHTHRHTQTHTRTHTYI